MSTPRTRASAHTPPTLKATVERGIGSGGGPAAAAGPRGPGSVGDSLIPLFCLARAAAASLAPARGLWPQAFPVALRHEDGRGGYWVAQLLILSSAPDAEVLPALGLLSHRVRQIPAEPASLVNAPACDLILVDARRDLASAKSLCKILTTPGITVPLVLVLTEGGLTAVSADWGAND